MDQDEFRKHLAVRHDGFWELLATASGHERSLQNTTSCLDGSAFKLGIGGVAGTPSLVQMRVEALAAFDPRKLVLVSKGWSRPADMKPDLLSAEMDLLDAAWGASLRFLVPSGTVSPRDLDTQRVWIRRELDVLLAPADNGTVDWECVVDGFATGRIGFAEARKLDKSDLSLAEIGERQVQDLMTRGTSGKPKFARMRVLRGRESRLTAAAAALVSSTLRKALAEHKGAVHWGEFAVAAETAIATSTDVCAELMERVIELLTSGTRPQDLAPLSYVLLRTGWTTP